ncbi:MAG: flavodoxin family protein [Clostridiales bacterium]|nr:flavodoxin family protein [Clostridiales bacterium]
MKVVIISASPNEIGLTNSCVNVCLETLKQESIETEWICLNNCNLKRCEACGHRGWGICLNEHRCKMDDDFNSLQEKIQEYDAYIIVSPVYFYEMSEVAKTFFDRLKRCQSFNEDSKLANKKMLCLACAGGSGDGTEQTLNSMSILAKFLHTEVVEYIGITRKNFEDKKDVIKQNTLKLIK